MALRHDTGQTMRIHMGGQAAAGIIFICTLLAYVVESQLTQYVQTTLNFRQPFLLFFIAHSSFTFIFPLHLLYLSITTSIPARAYISGLLAALRLHLSGGNANLARLGPADAFPTSRFAVLVVFLTAGITIPSLLWFAAVSLASVSDVTALWNSNAFWAYIISVKLQNSRWEPRRLASVVVASLGVLAVVYGGGSPASMSRSEEPAFEPVFSNFPSLVTGPKAPLLGNILTLIASVGYAFYQVMYKKHAALSNDPELESDDWQRRPVLYDSLNDSISTNVDVQEVDSLQMAYPPPFGLHPNFLISVIGLCTLCVLWICLPILDYLSVEPFMLPQNSSTYIAISGIIASALIFNAGYMILLGVWGPIITSVGNLLTIVLVLIFDVVFSGAAETLTKWSVLGSGMIVFAFAMLAYDMFRL